MKNKPQQFIDPSQYYVTFSIQAFEAGTETSYVENITGQLMQRNEDEQMIIGTFSGYRLRADFAVNDDVDFSEAFDSDSMDVSSHVFEVFQHDGTLVPDIRKVLSEEPEGDEPFLVASVIEIDPAHRGHGLGLLVMDAFIRMFSLGCSILIIHAAPMNPENIHEIHDTPEFKTAQKIGAKKLKAHWMTLGFKPLPKSEFLVLSLRYQAMMERPTLAEALKDAGVMVGEEEEIVAGE